MKKYFAIYTLVLAILISCGKKTDSAQNFSRTVVEYINNNDEEGLLNLYLSEEEFRDFLPKSQNPAEEKFLHKMMWQEYIEGLKNYKSDVRILLRKFHGKNITFLNCKFGSFTSSEGGIPKTIIPNLEITYKLNNNLSVLSLSDLIKSKNGWRCSRINLYGK